MDVIEMNKGYFYIEQEDYKKLTDINYRNKQSKIFENFASSKTRQFLILYLENYLYIDDIQYWIINEATRYENKISSLSAVAANHFSIRKHLENPDQQLTLYRKTLFEILL